MEIRDEHIEWEVVKRLKDMLEEPPQTNFSVTQSFALFTSILLWAKNRAWVAGRFPGNKPLKSLTDKVAHDARLELRVQKIVDPPWSLSQKTPIVRVHPSFDEAPVAGREINSDFKDATAEFFFEWLRNALAHGDGRNIRPIHAKSRIAKRALLVGFRVEGEGEQRALTLSLFHDDMRRSGSRLADQCCRSMSSEYPYLGR